MVYLLNSHVLQAFNEFKANLIVDFITACDSSKKVNCWLVYELNTGLGKDVQTI